MTAAMFSLFLLTVPCNYFSDIAGSPSAKPGSSVLDWNSKQHRLPTVKSAAAVSKPLILLFGYDGIFCKKIHYHINTKHPQLASTEICGACWVDSQCLGMLWHLRELQTRKTPKPHLPTVSSSFKNGMYCLITFTHRNVCYSHAFFSQDVYW